VHGREEAGEARRNALLVEGEDAVELVGPRHLVAVDTKGPASQACDPLRPGEACFAPPHGLLGQLLHGDIYPNDGTAPVLRDELAHLYPMAGCGLEAAERRPMPPLLQPFAYPGCPFRLGQCYVTPLHQPSKDTVEAGSGPQQVGDAGESPSIVLVAENEPIFGIEQRKAVGDALDRIGQPLLRAFGASFGQDLRGDIAAATAISAEASSMVEHWNATDTEVYVLATPGSRPIPEIPKRPPRSHILQMAAPLFGLVQVRRQLSARPPHHGAGSDADACLGFFGEPDESQVRPHFPEPIGAGVGEVLQAAFILLQPVAGQLCFTHVAGIVQAGSALVRCARTTGAGTTGAAARSGAGHHRGAGLRRFRRFEVCDSRGNDRRVGCGSGRVVAKHVGVRAARRHRSSDLALGGYRLSGQPPLLTLGRQHRRCISRRPVGGHSRPLPLDPARAITRDAYERGGRKSLGLTGKGIVSVGRRETGHR
jgi:hypothetical protein